MNQKSLFYHLAEGYEHYRTERILASSEKRPLGRPGWLRRLAKVLIPNIGTIVIVIVLLFAQSVGALPLGRPQTAPEAASTGTIAYQGRLADAAGAPITDTVNMTFRLYTGATGGTPLWSEPWTGSNGVKVSDGLFNVMLGSLTTLPQSAIAGRSQLFLGITVGTDDEMAPRVQLGSVPFAVQALTVPDGSVTTGKIADGAVTQAKLGADVSLVPPDGSITTAKLADGSVTSQKQSAAIYYLDDRSFVQSHSGESKVLSEFVLQQVPAGDLAFYCSFIASTDAATGFGGFVMLQASPGGDLAWVPTHIFSTHWDNYVVHGRLANFAGGNLTVHLRYSGEGGSTKVYFGASNGDQRFGRKCTVIAGI